MKPHKVSSSVIPTTQHRLQVQTMLPDLLSFTSNFVFVLQPALLSSFLYQSRFNIQHKLNYKPDAQTMRNKSLTDTNPIEIIFGFRTGSFSKKKDWGFFRKSFWHVCVTFNRGPFTRGLHQCCLLVEWDVISLHFHERVLGGCSRLRGSCDAGLGGELLLEAAVAAFCWKRVIGERRHKTLTLFCFFPISFTVEPRKSESLMSLFEFKQQLLSWRLPEVDGGESESRKTGALNGERGSRQPGSKAARPVSLVWRHEQG
ncbi:uncharacterized protein LOC125487528 [Rhincodon typus]|uniref:uncharacterized protein LOC125487528 n=1 Tax=Rhincodon typus TaxID=259920 RepID=UPI00202E8C15|nr:uncharacterized protein LOC125487528 [Rhincodon typus]